tara:strand:- start:339 stop:1469 length:1131 start_codon:yes stop_codon:yes gene_type:complete
MASTYKTFSNNDLTTTRTLLHEVIPLTGSIVSGTYVEGTTNETNIKNYSHGMFQSVYDYPYLSSSANHILDITVGYPSDSAMADATPLAQQMQTKKINIYNQMAQMLVGFDHTGAIRQFDADGDLTGGNKIKEAFFLSFARLLTKDEIQKNTFRMSLATGAASNADIRFGLPMTLGDFGADSAFKVNSPAGEYGVLYTSSAIPNEQSGVGLIYYQAGICVLTASIFTGSGGGVGDPLGRDHVGFGSAAGTQTFGSTATSGDTLSIHTVLSGTAISASADGFRARLINVEFNNTTELNSTIYFCRANHGDFNYSSNPTYLTGSKIRVKEVSKDQPVSYITTIGLYSADKELLAVAKISEPLKKTPSNELTLRVRLDY